MPDDISSALDLNDNFLWERQISEIGLIAPYSCPATSDSKPLEGFFGYTLRLCWPCLTENSMPQDLYKDIFHPLFEASIQRPATELTTSKTRQFSLAIISPIT